MSVPKLKQFDPQVIGDLCNSGNPPTIVFIGRRRCLGINTPVLMYDGYVKKVQDIVVGDVLIGDDSTPRIVRETCSGIDKMYKIKQSNGMEYIVNEIHVMTLMCTHSNKVIDIGVNDYLSLSKEYRECLKGIKATTINFNETTVTFQELTELLDNIKNGTLERLPKKFKFNSHRMLNWIFYYLEYTLQTVGAESLNNKELLDDLEFVANCIGLKKVSDTVYTPVIGNILSEISVEYVGVSTYYGFNIDGNNRFLLGDLTVTHNTGKSTLIKDMMWFMRNTPLFICMNGTEEGNGTYSEFVHPLMVHGDYKPDIVSGLLRRQKSQLKKLIKSGEDPNKHPEINAGLLLDDCGFDSRIKKDSNIRMLFMNGRHWKICFMLSLQYVIGIPPDLRSNIDYVFCLKENNKSNQKKLYDNFFGCFETEKDFRRTFEHYTENYGCLVLDNTSRSSNIRDCVFHYKANPNREYKMGPPEMWKYLSSRYKPQEDDSDEE